MDLKETELIGDDPASHWYYRSKARAMIRLLGARQPGTVLDVGAGSGFFSRYLLSHTGATDALWIDTGYDVESDTEVASKSLRFRRSAVGCDADLLVMMDVLEHVDDDCALLEEYVRYVRPGGLVLVSVPAFQWLWSGHDDFLEHRRRYTLSQVENLIHAVGLSVTTGAYFFGLVLPLAVAARLGQRLLRRRDQPPRSQLISHSALVNEFLSAICTAELPLMNANKLGGLTAFCLATKP